MKKTALLSVLIISVIIGALNLSYAQTFWEERSSQNATTTLPGSQWVHQIGPFWMILLLIGGALIFVGILFKGHPKAQKWIVIIGLGIIFVGTFAVEIIYLLPLLGKPVVGYQECKNLQGGWTEAAACIFTGYAPASWDAYNVATFIIFGFISPIVILFILFNEFTSGLITSPGAQRALAFVISLMAYRGLLATLFIDLLMYGFAGLGLLAVNYLIFWIIFSMLSKSWKWGETVEAIQKGVNLAELARLEEQRETLLRLRNNALAEGKMDVVKELEERIKRVEDAIKKLRRKT